MCCVYYWWIHIEFICVIFQITIEAIRGPGIYSDIAIDDAYLFDGNCNPSSCASHMDTSVNCTFDRTTCSYNNTDGQSSWSLSDTGSTGGELPMDHTSGKGEVIVGKNLINYFKNIISFMCVNFMKFYMEWKYIQVSK